MGLSSASLLLFIFGTITLASAYNDNDITYYIREAETDLSLDGSDYEVKLQSFGKSQGWYLQPTDYGRYIIVNKATGAVLDVETRTRGAFVVTRNSDNSDSQKWYFDSDGTIVNAGNNLALAVSYGTVTAGSPLMTYEKKAINSQIFTITSGTPYV